MNDALSILSPNIILSYKGLIVKHYTFKLQIVNNYVFFEKIITGDIYDFPRMKEIRENAGLKQKDIAEAMNVSKGSYSMWECGTDTIPLKRLNQFCNYFDVSIDYVVGFNDKKEYSKSKTRY